MVKCTCYLCKITHMCPDDCGRHFTPERKLFTNLKMNKKICICWECHKVLLDMGYEHKSK